MTAPMQSLPRNLPAPTSVALVIARLLTTAASQIGYREGKTGADWNNDNAFGLWYGTNGVSWCAQFVSWAAFAAGIPVTVIPRHQYTPTGWNWFTAHHCDVVAPRAGDIVYVYGYLASENQSRVHHVGIVEKVLSGGRIQTIEANTNTSGSAQGNGVYRLIRPISSTKLRFARPPYQLAVVAPPKNPTPPATGTPTPPKEADVAISDTQMTELKNHISDEVQRYAFWTQIFDLTMTDEKAAAVAAYEQEYAARKATGATDADSKLAAASKAAAIVQPALDTLKKAQKEI